MEGFKVTIPTKVFVGTNVDNKKHWFILNLNKYRNVHYVVNNKAKISFNKMVIDKIYGYPKMDQISIVYKITLPSKQSTDIMNVGAVVDKFFQDALVKANIIEDDNHNFVKDIRFVACGYKSGVYECEAIVKPYSQAFWEV